MARPALLALTIGWLVGLVMPSLAAGHAFGSFSISVFSQLTVAQDEVRVRWVVDMAELPAGVIVDLIDTDGDGVASEAEETAYLTLWIPSVLENLELSVDGADLSLDLVAHELSFPIGEGGAPFLRLVADLVSPLPAAQGTDVHEATYRDTNYTDYVGWREVAVAAEEGVSLVESSVAVEGRTKELTVYPPDLGMSVPSSEARFTFSLASADASADGSPASGPESAPAGRAFQIWPIGVLVLVVVLLLGVAVVISDRSAPRGIRR